MERKLWKMAGNFKNVPGLLPPYKTARWRRKERIRTKRTDLSFLLVIPFCFPFSPPSFIPPSLLCCVVSFPPSDGRRRRQRRFPGDFMDLHSPHCRTHGDRVHMTSKVCAEKCVPPQEQKIAKCSLLWYRRLSGGRYILWTSPVCAPKHEASNGHSRGGGGGGGRLVKGKKRSALHHVALGRSWSPLRSCCVPR